MKPRLALPRLTTRMSPVEARSGTRTCMRVPVALMVSGVTGTSAVWPSALRVLNSTVVPALKSVPSSSMTWPTLAEACAALAATPLPALASTLLSVGVTTAAVSTRRSTR